MAKRRPGYKTLTLQLPEVVVAALYADAAAQGVSATRIVVEGCLQKYRIGRDALPPNRKAGRKPKDTQP